MVQGAGLPAMRDRILGGPDLMRCQSFQMIALAVENPDMRPEELVGGAGKKITVQRGHINRAMRHKLNGVHKDQRTRFMGQPCQQSDIGDRTDRIGGVRNCDKPRPAGPQRRLITLKIERPVFGVNIDGPNDSPLRGKIGPGGHICIVIQVGDHNLIARLQCLTEGAGKVECQGGHAGAKNYRAGIVWGPEQIRHRLTCISDHRISALTGRKHPTDIGIAAGVIAGDRINDADRHLSSARIIQENCGRLLTQSRKLRPQGRKVNGRQGIESVVHLRYNCTMKILVPAPLLEELIVPVAARVPDAVLTPYDEDPALSPPHADEAEIVLRWVAGKRYAGLVANGPKVRWLHTASAGVDHVLTPEVKAKPGLILTDSGPAFGIAMGEFVLTWMLMVTHRMPELLAQQQSHTWSHLTQEELHGQTVGIIGLGPVGQGIAARCSAFGMRTLGLRRRKEPVPGIDQTLTGADGLERLLRESDWVIIAAALTGETRSLLGADEIAKMKPSARLVNIARGALVDETALIAALQSKSIAGACLDVFVEEPLPAGNPLWDMPHVLIAPHNSPGWTSGLRERQKEIFLSNLEKYVRGGAMAGVVDIARGY